MGVNGERAATLDFTCQIEALCQPSVTGKRTFRNQNVLTSNDPSKTMTSSYVWNPQTVSLTLCLVNSDFNQMLAHQSWYPQLSQQYNKTLEQCSEDYDKRTAVVS